MNQRNCTIGLDIGTTSVKAVALSDDGTEVARVSRRVPTHVPEPDASLQDPEAVYTTVTAVLADCTRRAMAMGCAVRYVGLSAAMHSLMVVDEVGHPLTPAWTWMDVRAAQDANSLWQSDTGVALYERTGTPIHAMSPLCKLMWLRRVQPELFAAGRRFVSLKEFVWYRWFREWCVDESIASATGLLDIRRRKWDETALQLAGVQSTQLSRVVPTSYRQRGIRDTTLCEAGLADVWVNVGASDGALANLGAAVWDDGAVVLSAGTSLALRGFTEQPVSDAAFRPFSYILDSRRYVVGAPSNSGGILLDWLHNEILRPDASDASDASGLAGADLGSRIADVRDLDIDDLICLPYVAGERAPLWDASAKASLIGLQLAHRPAHILRAAVEGVVFNACVIAERLFESTGRPPAILASGRLFEAAWVRQLIADLLAVRVRQYPGGDASATGAILLAHQAVGEAWPGLDAYRTRYSLLDTPPSAVLDAGVERRFQLFRGLLRSMENPNLC